MRNHLRRSTFLASAALMAATLLASDPLTESASAQPIAWRADTGATGVRRAAVHQRRSVRGRASRSGYRTRMRRVSRSRVWPAPLPPGTDAWGRLRHCESGGRYDIATGNGFYGAYQFLASTWRGLGYSGLPHHASPDVQDEAARKLQARSGWGQWPACSRRLGLR